MWIIAHTDWINYGAEGFFNDEKSAIDKIWKDAISSGYNPKLEETKEDYYYCLKNTWVLKVVENQNEN